MPNRLWHDGQASSRSIHAWNVSLASPDDRSSRSRSIHVPPGAPGADERVHVMRPILRIGSAVVEARDHAVAAPDVVDVAEAHPARVLPSGSSSSTAHASQSCQTSTSFCVTSAASMTSDTARVGPASRTPLAWQRCNA